jgi:hypothetical protein
MAALAWPWESVVAMNHDLCAARKALHKTTGANAEVQTEWQARVERVWPFAALLQFLLWCHRKAPLCFYNGNTFAAIARQIVGALPLPPESGGSLRSAAGHFVAGVLSPNDLDALLTEITLPESWQSSPE